MISSAWKKSRRNHFSKSFSFTCDMNFVTRVPSEADLMRYLTAAS